MPLPQTPFTIHGGCNCRAIRYTVSVPTHAARPKNPYRNPDTDIGDLRIPMVAIDHCNDCRRATGALLPMAVVTDMATVAVTCAPRSSSGSTSGDRRGEAGAEADATLTIAATELFNPQTISARDVFLTSYKSSPGRTRWFCARCGTSLAYTIDAGSEVAASWGFRMLDLWLGSVDRADLEGVPLLPERRLWCDVGVPWIREFAARGFVGLPAHPTTKIDEREREREAVVVVVQQGGVEGMLAEARARLLRLAAAEAWAEVREAVPGRPVVLVDIRPQAQRAAEGVIEGALVVERNVLEWRFDPLSDARLPVAGSYDLRVIVFCQEGYTSSLAARSLQEIGLVRATDVVGGYKAWRESKLPEKI